MVPVNGEVENNVQLVGFLEPQSFWLLAPAIALLLGASASLWISVGQRSTSGLLHLAAGVVTAAVAVDLVPEMIGPSKILAVVIGFAAGTILVMGLRALSSHGETESTEAPGPRKLIGLLSLIGVDLVIDGLLVGIAIAVSGNGAILGIAISIETLALGLAFGVTLAAGRVGKGRLLLIMFMLSVLLLVGGGAGLLLAGSFTGNIRTAVIAFGAAALLYLVVEELLVEAHRSGDTALGSLLFFVGFGGGVVLASISE